MANSGLANLIGPALEKVCDAASGRKYATLRQEAAVSPPAPLRRPSSRAGACP